MTSTAPHQALYRRWRAQTFAQIVGQEAVVHTLRNAVRTDRVAHAILFVGPRGTGKTSLARILAKALNCTELQDGDPCDRCDACVAVREGTTLDVLEIDAASNRGINEIKDLRERLQYAPAQLRRKVYILDEAHQITRDAWNALLKSLEEPPDFVVFMFASTHPQEFPPAILSRLQRYDVRRLTVGEIEGKLRRILEADKRQAEPAAIQLIARLAAGGMRDAESMLDQLLSTSRDQLDEAQVRDLLGLADTEAVERFGEALVHGDAVAGIEILDRLEERGRDLRVFLDQLVEAIRGMLVQGLSHPGTGGPGTAHLAAVARRLAAIDPNRAGIGGLRLQLELTLFAEQASAETVDGLIREAAIPRVRMAGPAGSILPATPSDRTTVRTAGTPVMDPVPLAPASPPQPVSAAHPDSSSHPASAPQPSSTAPLQPAPGVPGPARAMPTAPPGRDVGEDAASQAPRDPLVVAEDLPPGRGIAQPAPTSDDLASLQTRWTEVVARISQHPPTKPLIGACRPISVEGNVVTLGFPEDQAFLRDVAERRRPVLESGIAEFLGRPVAVRCVATNLDAGPPTDSNGDYVLAEARRIFGDDLADVGEVS